MAKVEFAESSSGSLGLSQKVISQIQTDVEQQFFEWASALIGDWKWSSYRTLPGLDAMNDFTTDYTKLLSKAFVVYITSIQSARINLGPKQPCDWRDIESAAFKFVGRFIVGRYHHPWTGHFLSPEAPEFRRIHAAAPWRYTTPEMWERRFEREVRTGSWKQIAVTNAKEKLRLASASATSPTAPIKRRSIQHRRTFITPILEQKGYSIRDWATAASVDLHTANNYLKGKTKPYPNTRKKLADALGVRIEDFPY
jgi:lambda repressor-like predicted transcriptional regulator